MVPSMPLFGEKIRFAAEVGEYSEGSSQLRRVDLWAGGRWLTCDDNTAFIPQFRGDVRRTLDWLRSKSDLSPPFLGMAVIEMHKRLAVSENREGARFAFPDWGPTTDNLLGYLFRRGEHFTMTFEFWRQEHTVPEERGVVFLAEVSEQELVGVLEEMLTALEEDGG